MEGKFDRLGLFYVEIVALNDPPWWCCSRWDLNRLTYCCCFCCWSVWCCSTHLFGCDTLVNLPPLVLISLVHIYMFIYSYVCVLAYVFVLAFTWWGGGERMVSNSVPALGVVLFSFYISCFPWSFAPHNKKGNCDDRCGKGESRIRSRYTWVVL